MKFSEAMQALTEGKKVARHSWTDKIYLSMVENEVKAYRSSLRHYNYDSSIFMCDGWYIGGSEKEYFFHEIVDFLYGGCIARLKEWGDAYIYYDKEDKDLVYQYMEEFFFVPEFKDLLADDWEAIW